MNGRLFPGNRNINHSKWFLCYLFCSSRWRTENDLQVLRPSSVLATCLQFAHKTVLFLYFSVCANCVATNNEWVTWRVWALLLMTKNDDQKLMHMCSLQLGNSSLVCCADFAEPTQINSPFFCWGKIYVNAGLWNWNTLFSRCQLVLNNK